MRYAIISLLCIAALAPNSFAQAPKEKAAEQVAEQWLAIVDSGDYARSWQESASIFRSSVTEQQWTQLVKSVRSPLGQVVSRKLASAHYTTQLPGVPDGQYVVVQFNTSFEHKKSAVETVTPMLDKDGKWRVSGYYMK
jgi:hypothetical protein